MEAPSPPPDVQAKAWETLVQYGAIGSILVIVLALAIFLVWWTLRTTAKAIKEKDEYIQAINEARVTSAENAVAAITKQNEQGKRIMEMLNQIVAHFQKGVSDDPADPQ